MNDDRTLFSSPAFWICGAVCFGAWMLLYEGVLWLWGVGT